MRLETRKLLDRSFTGLGSLSVILMGLSLVIILAPIMVRGAHAYLFRATAEFRRLEFEQFGRGDIESMRRETEAVASARRPIDAILARFDAELEAMPRAERRRYREPLRAVNDRLRDLLGPLPGDSPKLLMRSQYGQTRWDRALVKLHAFQYDEQWDYSDPSKPGIQVFVPRQKAFAGTALNELFPAVDNALRDIMRPRLTFYWRFITDTSMDSHIFGGIWPEVLGTLYLTVGAMIFAVPMGVIAAIYLCEYASQGRVVSLLRACISTLAGVPSIVFGLFGLAFFLNTVHVSPNKSVLAGSLTLALMVLPTVIRAAEEAILAVPRTYKEAALGLGAGRWHTVMTVILPAALPGILTGIVISMGRAAGETAPIIFTAAVSLGEPLRLLDTLRQPTPALPWNIYNLCTEHEAVDEIRHVQYGMVFTLVSLVLILNLAAIVLRARISKKLRG